VTWPLPNSRSPRAATPARAPLLAASLLALAACRHVSLAPAGSAFGTRRELAVEVCYPPGEERLVRRLRCPGGAPPKEVERVSVGNRTPARTDDVRPLEQLDAGRPLRPGEPDFHIVDKLTLSCPDGERALYLDMYHCFQPPPAQAPAGWGLADEE
jgi:hypothetical protein